MIFCFKNKKLKLAVISFIFSCTLIIFQIGSLNFDKKLDINVKIEGYYENTEENNAIAVTSQSGTGKNNVTSENIEIWKIEIPKIELIAEISEGTTEQILDEFVGHFEETSKEKGNVGLAAHNRGYKVNHFEKIKFLEIGDEIFYTYNEITRKYIVTYKSIIEDTDWSKLEKTEENKLTLITCVENQPSYRLCLQAIEENY